MCVCAYSALRVPQGYVDGKWYYCDVWGGGGERGVRATRLGASKAFNKEMALRLVLSGKKGGQIENLKKSGKIKV